MTYFDISFTVEVESKDVFDKLFADLSQLVCDGTGEGVDHHQCRRNWVGAYKSVPEVDEGEDAATRPVSDSLELT